MRTIYTLATALFLTFNGITKAEQDVDPSDVGTKLMQEASKSDPKKADPLKVEVNPKQLEDKFTKDPEFSSDSYDQEKRDKVVAAISEKFSQKSEDHVLKLISCQNSAKANPEEIKKCRQMAVSKKSK